MMRPATNAIRALAVALCFSAHVLGNCHTLRGYAHDVPRLSGCGRVRGSSGAGVDTLVGIDFAHARFA